MFSLLMTLAAASATPVQVDLAIDDRWGLVAGLKDEVGGAFVLTGLADADGLCRYTGTCVTTRRLMKSDSSAINSVDDLITQVRVGKDRPKTIVAVRGASVTRGATLVYLSIYDPQTKRWEGKTATLTDRSGTPGTDGNLRGIKSLTDAPAFDI